MTESEHAENQLPNGNLKSKYIAHYGIRTRQLKEMISWYKIFFNAEVLYQNEFAAFMTFDDEHHRLVLWTDEDTKDKPENVAGIDHIGIGLQNFRELIEAYERLKAQDIIPFLPVNHRFTTSLYYKDPDGNEVELTVDNFPSKDLCGDFVRSEKMEEILIPPFGDVFDPDELAQAFHQGVSDEELAKIGMEKS